MHRVAIDIGGTFTDLVSFKTNSEGIQEIKTTKSDTTPQNFSQGFLNVLNQESISMDSIEYLSHGTTVIINALTEKKGVKTGLITTKGFRDVLEIARGNRPDFFNLDYQKPNPFVPRYLRKEITERISFKGEIIKKLNEEEIDEIISFFKNENVKSLAICFLNSYTNPIHEQLIKKLIEEKYPNEFTIVISTDITREWREYERTSTTTLCSYIKPIAQDYLSELSSNISEKCPFYLMQSNGGADTIENIREIPITMVESGPASGMYAVNELGKLLGEKNLIGLDIGGTTAKCTLIKDNNIRINSDYYIKKNKTSAGYPILIPCIDILEIGNGGGSIAWINEYDKLNVGPQSAGAYPGPIAYGKGGKVKQLFYFFSDNFNFPIH